MSSVRPAGEGAGDGDSFLKLLKNSLPGPADLAGAASMLERILRESVCQLQGWLRIYGKARDPPAPPYSIFPLPGNIPSILPAFLPKDAILA